MLAELAVVAWTMISFVEGSQDAHRPARDSLERGGSACVPLERVEVSESLLLCGVRIVDPQDLERASNADGDERV